MLTIYRKIAKSSLMNEHILSEEEINYKIEHESIEELESQVHAKGSIQHAIVGMAKECGLSNEDAISLFTAIVQGPVDAEIISRIAGIDKDFSNDNILNVLTVIHDEWVKDNSSERTFQKKCGKKQLRQYAPIELIGWNEVKSDLLFLAPILESVGVQVDEQTLEKSYHERVEKYMSDRKIGTKKDLKKLVEKGKEYYDDLPEELADKLSTMTEDVVEQIIDNWKNKDPEVVKIMADVEKKNMSI